MSPFEVSVIFSDAGSEREQELHQRLHVFNVKCPFDEYDYYHVTNVNDMIFNCYLDQEDRNRDGFLLRIPTPEHLKKRNWTGDCYLIPYRKKNEDCVVIEEYLNAVSDAVKRAEGNRRQLIEKVDKVLLEPIQKDRDITQKSSKDEKRDNTSENLIENDEDDEAVREMIELMKRAEELGKLLEK